MTFLYIVVAGILGLIFLGPVGAVIGGIIGIVFGTTQSNYRRIVKLEKEINDLKNNKS
jgi:phosphotransferase system  glucose/maltose/N-acetylglucosamine-specific IIC component